MLEIRSLQIRIFGPFNGIHSYLMIVYLKYQSKVKIITFDFPKTLNLMCFNIISIILLHLTNNASQLHLTTSVSPINEHVIKNCYFNDRVAVPCAEK